MGSSDYQKLPGLTNYSMPSVDQDGNWGTVGGVALRAALREGDASGVISLLKSTDTEGLVTSLREAGFDVDDDIAQRGRSAIFGKVQHDLSMAVKSRADGFLIRSARTEQAHSTFAPKEYDPSKGVIAALDFRGDTAAANAVQDVLHASKVNVELLGEAMASQRNALVLVAGQALKMGTQGFGFDGIEGKYKVKLSMAQLTDLHRDAAQSVATESARSGLAGWVKGEKAHGLSEWVPDSVQRLLQGSLSLQSAQAIVGAINGGAIARHAGEIGVHGFSTMLREQGFDINAPTVKEQARDQSLIIIEPDRARGQYFGPVVAVDYRAALVKRSQVEVIELPFEALPAGQKRPKIGDAVRIGYKAGVMSLSLAQRSEREAIGR